jgi:hypothetical protein
MILYKAFMHNSNPFMYILSWFLTKPLFSRMALEMRGQAGSNPPPPPEPDMAQVLRLMLEEREAACAERQANLATLQHSPS